VPPTPLPPLHVSRSCFGSSHGPSIPTARVNHTAAAAVADFEPEPEPDSHDASTSAPSDRPAPRARRRSQKLSKQELLSLVDAYDDEQVGSVEDYLQYLRDPYMRGYAPANTPRFTFVHTQEEHDYPSADEVLQGNDDTRQTLWELRFSVLTRLRSPHRVHLDRIYELYRRLPEPRMLYIPARLRHQFLRTLGQPDDRNAASMLRYLEVIADVRNTGISLTSAEWNCAIAFATKYVGTITDTEVEAALKLWREMEIDAGIQATNVTFNILFDVACKAGNFALAEMLYREMESRGHLYNRYHYTSLIHFFGLKNETGGMRAAYREMVEAGEIIDTVVLNAMIGGFLRSGEEGPAESLYERMKAISLEKSKNSSPNGSETVIPVRTPASDRAITQALHMFAKIARRHPPSRPALQRLALLSPDLQTYRILVNHYGVRKGDIARVAAYLDDMKLFNIPLHHAIFLALFKAFAAHGGYPTSPWSERRLLGIWNALIDALDHGTAPGLEIRSWLAVWALRAFKRCCGSHDEAGREKVWDVYESLRARWSLKENEEVFMRDFMEDLMSK
jgi:pentatricopeptide repeat protein